MDKFTPDLSMQHLLMKTRIEIEQTSGYGQSIFKIYDDEDTSAVARFMPLVQQQLPTNVAHWLKYACEHSDKGLDHFTKTSQNPK